MRNGSEGQRREWEPASERSERAQRARAGGLGACPQLACNRLEWSMGVGAKGAGIASRQLCLPWRVPSDRSPGTDAERFGGAAEGIGLEGVDMRLRSLFPCPDDVVQGFPLHEGGRKPERAERARGLKRIWRGIGGNGGLPSERSERGSEGHRREPGAPERAKRARVCLPAHAYACACSAQARTGYSFVYRGFRWVCGVFFIVIAYRIY